ncbi:MAG: DNA repair protein RadC [Steroidobacteraceae bacterium]
MTTTSLLLVRDVSNGELREATSAEVLTAARTTLSRRMRQGTKLTSPEVTRDYLRLQLAEREHEVFCIIYLDTRHRVIDCQELFRGTIDGASIYPREVLKEALRRNAAACILAHNHPSGVAEPSHADELITRRLKEALWLVEIRVLDHLIVAGGEVVSFAERGLL